MTGKCPRGIPEDSQAINRGILTNQMIARLSREEGETNIVYSLRLEMRKFWFIHRQTLKQRGSVVVDTSWCSIVVNCYIPRIRISSTNTCACTCVQCACSHRDVQPSHVNFHWLQNPELWKNSLQTGNKNNKYYFRNTWLQFPQEKRKARIICEYYDF